MKPNLENFKRFLKLSSLNITFIVEGKKDKKVLNSLGFKNVISISNQSPRKVKNKIKTKEIVILTDFDKEGENLRKKFETYFHSYNFKVNYFIPKIVRSLGIKKIEELNFYKRLTEYKAE